MSDPWVPVARVRVDHLPSHPTVPVGPASTDVTNQRHQEKETDSPIKDESQGSH